MKSEKRMEKHQEYTRNTPEQAQETPGVSKNRKEERQLEEYHE